jgi:IS5 family transposase
MARMPRVSIAQQFFGFSDEGIEDATYDSRSIREFVGVDLTHESAPTAQDTQAEWSQPRPACARKSGIVFVS